jgi:hypothetical protein
MYVSVGSILHRITPRALPKILLKDSLLIKGSIYQLFIIHQQKGIRGTKAPAGTTCNLKDVKKISHVCFELNDDARTEKQYCTMNSMSNIHLPMN